MHDSFICMCYNEECKLLPVCTVYNNNYIIIITVTASLSSLFYFLQTENHFFGVTRSFVQEFCRTCPICRINYPKNRPTFKSYPPAVKRVLQSYRTRGNHSPVKSVSKMVRGRRQLGLPDFDPKNVADIVTDCSLVEADSNDWTVASMKVLLDMNSTPVAVQCEPHSAPTQIKGSSPPDHEYGAQAQRAAGALVEPQFMARIQVDLIDMSASPDGDFHYICHMVDYFSKYRVLFPLKNNSSNEVGLCYSEFIAQDLGGGLDSGC